MFESLEPHDADFLIAFVIFGVPTDVELTFGGLLGAEAYWTTHVLIDS